MVTGTKQLLNSFFGREGNTLESDLLQSCLAWQKWDTQQASSVCRALDHWLPWLTCVARLRTCWTSSCVSEGFFKNSFTIAVRRVSCTWERGAWERLEIHPFINVSQVSTSFTDIKHKTSVSSLFLASETHSNELRLLAVTKQFHRHIPEHQTEVCVILWCTPSLPKFWSPVQPFPQEICNLWNPLQICLVLPRREFLEIQTTKQNCRFPGVLF